MRILYSPQFNDENKIEYTFFGEIIKVETSTLVEKEEKSNFELDSVFYYDLSSVKEGTHSRGKHHIVSARRVAGELEIQLLMYIGDDASQDERFPEEFVSEDEQFDIPEGTEIIQLEEIVMPEPETDKAEEVVKENEELKRKISQLEKRVKIEDPNELEALQQTVDSIFTEVLPIFLNKN